MFKLGYVFLQDWRRVRVGVSFSATQYAYRPLTWSRPLGGHWKYNLDAAMFSDLSVIGLDMVMRRNDG